ncbi:hypothetical protein [Vibrio alfacsensis]|uniref:hypothetical protein n=1 Tax=Vibrio TaxID=662 RepID=UPI0040685F7D
MRIGYAEIQRTLLRLECRTVHKVKKVVEYMLPGTKEPFYLHLENCNPQLIIKPAHSIFMDEFAQLRGVHPKEPFYHNTDMTRFPKRLHKGKTECHFGIAFEFSDAIAVERFINKVVGIVKGGS